MVIYTEAGTTYRVCWASKPYVINQGDDAVPVKLLGIRLAGDTLQVALLAPPLEVQWVAPEKYISAEDAERWAKNGFRRTPWR
jgi:hypothetical protein